VGLEMIEREMLTTFERFGIASIDALGEKFDHNLHEAMFEIENADQPTGTVIQELETGYMLNERLLRPAKVGVTKGSPKEKEPTDVPGDEDHARDSQQAYESKGEEPGAQLDEEH
ncbi:MAG: nucleotide exchange factor GrpE, partial [Pseudomonadota bacterium]|nr:nucleotide exchange factor GrpE [Pseudomonadota bacterium]